MFFLIFAYFSTSFAETPEIPVELRTTKRLNNFPKANDMVWLCEMFGVLQTIGRQIENAKEWKCCWIKEKRSRKDRNGMNVREESGWWCITEASKREKTTINVCSPVQNYYVIRKVSLKSKYISIWIMCAFPNKRLETFVYSSSFIYLCMAIRIWNATVSKTSSNVFRVQE